MLLAEQTWRQVAAYLEHDDRIIVPVGSTEQHGLRAVIGTDHLVPAGIAREAGRQAGVLVAPSVNYGMALHHMAFPGTISLRPSTLQRVIYDLVASLAQHGFLRVLFLNGHGGNTASLQAGIAEVNDVYREMRLKLRSWWELPGVEALQLEAFGERGEGHGTPGETALTMALHPGIVSDEPVEVRRAERPAVWPNALVWAETYPTGSANANANLATAAWGEKLLELTVAAVVEELRTW